MKNKLFLALFFTSINLLLQSGYDRYMEVTEYFQTQGAVAKQRLQNLKNRLKLLDYDPIEDGNSVDLICLNNSDWFVCNSSFFSKEDTKVLKKGDLIIGFVQYHMDFSIEVGSLDHLLIDKAQQGNGYGRRLLQIAINEMVQLGAKKIKLEVEPNNIKARELYKNFGFRPVSNKSVDRLRMIRIIEEM